MKVAILGSLLWPVLDGSNASMMLSHGAQVLVEDDDDTDVEVDVVVAVDVVDEVVVVGHGVAGGVLASQPPWTKSMQQSWLISQLGAQLHCVGAKPRQTTSKRPSFAPQASRSVVLHFGWQASSV